MRENRNQEVSESRYYDLVEHAGYKRHEIKTSRQYVKLFILGNDCSILYDLELNEHFLFNYVICLYSELNC